MLDNASIHTSRKIKERLTQWECKGLFIFYLPPYSPQLNIVEILWRKLKYEWLKPSDYQTSQTLFYAVWQILAAVGIHLIIKFSPFRLSLD